MLTQEGAELAFSLGKPPSPALLRLCPRRELSELFTWASVLWWIYLSGLHSV